MQKHNVFWMAMLTVLISCGAETAESTDDADTDTTEETVEYFNEEIEFNTTLPAASTAVYLPFSWYQALAVPFEPPEPPYQIRSLAILGFNWMPDNDDPTRGNPGFYHDDATYKCSSAAALEFVAWIHSDSSLEPNTYTVTDAVGTPHLPALISGITTGVGPESEEPMELMTVTFDPPVRVNDSGTLYVAARRQEPVSEFAPCIFGAGYDGTDPTWTHATGSNGSSGWSVDASTRPDFRVTFGTHAAE